jgi:Holliday junction resolvase RusA-like endonuclease
MSDSMRWFLLEINPEQWAIGDISVGRKNGGLFPIVGRNAQLYNYQQGVKELLDGIQMLPEGKYRLEFFFWRQQITYQGTRKKVKKNQVDATNLQKALEDALQGVLFGNDRDVVDIHSVIVEQGPNVKPMVVLGVEYLGARMSDTIFELPQAVYELIESMDKSQYQLELDLPIDSLRHPAADDEDVF